MFELLIATKNIGKFREMMEVFADLTNQINFRFLGEFENLEDAHFEEDGETFADNAYKKAKFYGDLLGIPAIGEDSGILVDAFPGELGVKTRRWGAGANATDLEWITYFLEKMKDVPEGKRGAKFVCSSYLYFPLNGRAGAEAEGHANAQAEADVDRPEREDFAIEAETCGRITQGLEAKIQPGIPLSACFVAEGRDKVYSAMSEAEKNSLSHRGKAMKKMKEVLSAFICN
jgi:XTP/dITP diphosphohydrolase